MSLVTPHVTAVLLSEQSVSRTTETSAVSGIVKEPRTRLHPQSRYFHLIEQDRVRRFGITSTWNAALNSGARLSMDEQVRSTIRNSEPYHSGRSITVAAAVNCLQKAFRRPRYRVSKTTMTPRESLSESFTEKSSERSHFAGVVDVFAFFFIE